MIHKIFKSKNNLAIAIPQTAIQQMGLYENSEMPIVVNVEHQRIVLQPAHLSIEGIDGNFAHHLDKFIEQYRPALNALAK